MADDGESVEIRSSAAAAATASGAGDAAEGVPVSIAGAGVASADDAAAATEVFRFDAVAGDAFPSLAERDTRDLMKKWCVHG
jgi:hypothetical protein